MDAAGYVVTTGRRPGPQELSLAAWFARRLCAPLVPRENLSLKALEEKYGARGVLVVAQRRASFYTGGVEVFFHPSMAKLRIAEIKTGKTDQMVKAMDLRPGEEVLDCTLGLGVDAIVASFVVGPAGRVVGVESSPVLAALVEHGLGYYCDRLPREVLEAMRRIEVICGDHLSYLKGLPAESFDVVYFDPMFREPLHRSPAIGPLRALANDAPLARQAVEEAVRVARRRVVMKERRGSREFARLGFTCVQGGKSSPVAYGVIEK
ncbi:class I SAM-dependent methyltransferase [Desulfovirgula thermocuniculi]|uniref:class I SAM-dependent methyltransferase n=1 Tax=Desulfovirgula thermocuniculi TaxID=348842 RepID=UPI0004089491|nr:class I SAM-dependent methyltransferase [Desulfovirgula thermocuniculi]